MPQESRTKVEILREIYSVIEEEVREAAAEQYGLLLVGDLNCKVGDERIQGNLKKITTGGRLLNSLIKGIIWLLEMHKISAKDSGLE